MLYQFMCWRVGRLGKRLYVCSIEDLFKRLRDANYGVLPMYLNTWSDYQIFAGQSQIALPEREAAARAVFANNEMYPALKWLQEQYTKLLEFVTTNKPILLDDPPEGIQLREKQAEKVEDKNFSEIVDESVSNVKPKEVVPVGEGSCSELDPATSSPTLTLIDSLKMLSTEQKPRPPMKPH